MFPRGPARLVWAATTAVQLISAAAAVSISGTGAEENPVLRWNGALLEAVRTGSLGPPMVARAMAIAHTCGYDAWAAYDDTAAGTRLGGALRRPAAERTQANRAEAFSFGFYQAAVDLYPARTEQFTELLHQQGYDTSASSQPAKTAYAACGAVLSFRHHDGSNQLGDLAPGAYSDYTGYRPVNSPMVVAGPIDPGTVRDPNRWQPLVFTNSLGRQVTQAYLAPQWGNVTPFAMRSGDELRSPNGPAIFDKKAYAREAQAVLDLSANLTDRQKAISEYWSDGPNSETPPGHWNLFARHVSQRDNHAMDDDVRMFFVLNNALLDASICAWDNKLAYDSVRPITAIRYLYDGKQVRAWAGPGLGTRTIDGGTWKPYQPATFPTPPFGEFASGHSTFSAAAATVLKRFTGSDRFGLSATVRAGSSRIEPGITPAADITLSWPTFTAAADEAGLSRRYGGIHLEEGDEDARKAGQRIGQDVWTKAGQLFHGN
ncbi:vanadium-dependent haloperoxidase [Flindersiella endophytica]